MKSNSLLGQTAEVAASLYLQAKKPSKTPFVVAGILCTILILVAIFAVGAERRVSTTDLSAIATDDGGLFASPKTEENILQTARRKERNGSVLPAGSRAAPGGGIATDVRLQDVNSDGTKDLVVVGPTMADGSVEVTGYAWNGTMFEYDTELTWALSTSRSLFPEP